VDFCRWTQLAAGGHLSPAPPLPAAPVLSPRSSSSGATWELEMTVPAGPQSASRTVHLTLGAHPELSLDAAQKLATWHWEQLRRWGLDTAQKIGVEVAAAAIKSAIGLP